MATDRNGLRVKTISNFHQCQVGHRPSVDATFSPALHDRHLLDSTGQRTPMFTIGRNLDVRDLTCIDPKTLHAAHRDVARIDWMMGALNMTAIRLETAVPLLGGYCLD
jgi:hypothetical protein